MRTFGNTWFTAASFLSGKPLSSLAPLRPRCSLHLIKYPVPQCCPTPPHHCQVYCRLHSISHACVLVIWIVEYLTNLPVYFFLCYFIVMINPLFNSQRLVDSMFLRYAYRYKSLNWQLRLAIWRWNARHQVLLNLNQFLSCQCLPVLV